MAQDIDVLTKHLELIYGEKEPPKVVTLFTDMISQLSNVNARDSLKLSLFHHFCMLSDVLETDLNSMKNILTLLLAAKQAEGENDIFLGFVPQIHHEEKKEEAKKEEAKKEEGKEEIRKAIRQIVTDAWGGTGLHYLARRKKYVALETVLRTFAETGNSKEKEIISS